MKRFLSKISLVLAVACMFSFVSFPSYAADMFTDVGSDNWAKEYIETMVQKGIMQGLPDGTFRPNEKVNKIQAVVMLSKLMNPTKDEVLKARAKYGNVIDKLKLDEENKNGLAIGLSKGIINEKLLANDFFDNGNVKNAQKLEVCLYLVRAMGLESQTQNRPSALLFKDTENIPRQARPYIDVLIEKGIINNEGDGQGKFNPNSSITKGVMSKMLYLAYMQMNNDAKIPENDDTNDNGNNLINTDTSIIDSKDTEEVVGNIIAVAGDYILVQNGNKNNSFKITSDTLINIDGKSSEFTDLQKGMTVKILFNKNDNTLVAIENESSNETYSGTIKSLSLGASPKVEIECKQDDKKETKSFYLTNKTSVSLDGKDAFLYNLKEGDLVTVEVINNTITRLTGESKDGLVKGILKDKKYDEGLVLVVEREDKTTFEYNVDESINVKRNGSKSNINDLRKGDKIDVTLTYGNITGVEAKSVEGQDEGTITSILISQDPQITITNAKAEECTYHISKDVIINVDGELKEIYDLRLGYYGRLKLESDEITSLDVDKKEQTNEFIGNVEYLNLDGRIIVLKADSSKDSMSLNISTNVSIKDMDGRSINFSDLKKGQKILVKGSTDKGYFIVDKVIVIK